MLLDLGEPREAPAPAVWLQHIHTREQPGSATAQGSRVLSKKSPDTPGSPEGNTEGPGTASSEPLLPS